MLVSRQFFPYPVSQDALAASVYDMHGLQSGQESVIDILAHKVAGFLEVLSDDIDLSLYGL